jgi:hypothetical protein
VPFIPAFKGVRVAEQAGKVTFSRVPLASVALFADVTARVKLPAVGNRSRERCDAHLFATTPSGEPERALGGAT